MIEMYYYCIPIQNMVLQQVNDDTQKLSILFKIVGLNFSN
jgi:hypothetical protein